MAAKGAAAGVTKKGIHEWLLHRYPGEDLAGYNAFTQFIAQRTASPSGPPTAQQPHALRDAARLQLQFDWKSRSGWRTATASCSGVQRVRGDAGPFHGHIFIRSGTRTTDDLVRCMYATIARLGGVPREWVTDEHVRPGDGQGGRRLKVQRAYEFAKAAGFELKLCRPRSPQTKGRSSRRTASCRGSRPTRATSTAGTTSTRSSARIEDASNSEPNETTGLPPSALFMEEKDALLPVGNLRAPRGAMGDVVRVARVPATMLVKRARRAHVGAQALHRQARPHRLHARRRDGLLRRRRAGGDARGGRAAYDPAHYAEPWPASWFGDAAGDIGRRPPPTSGCSTR